MSSIYGKASNRLNELSSEIPIVKKQFDSLINSIASWKQFYSVKMELKLSGDLQKLMEKWERKARKEADRKI
tara:strand:- start:1006 stop:1221 length:216 start_codon:yes stop_codon:yes gene_type:complete